MPHSAIDTASTRTRRLRAEIEAELSHPAGRLAPELELIYRADIAAERASDLGRKAVYCAAVYICLALLLVIFAAGQLSWSRVVAIGGLPPAFALLIGVAYFRPDTPDWQREAAALASSLVYTLSVLLAVSFVAPHAMQNVVPAQNTVTYLVLVALPVSFVLVFVHLRLSHAVMFVAIATAALAICLAMRPGLSLFDESLPIGFLACLCLPSLVGVHAREQSARRIFLHALLQRLRIEHLSAENEQLSRLSTTDPLTGIANRRRLDLDLKAFCAGAAPHGAFLLIDLDGFKSFNDRHGHIAGDACLQQIATCMAGQLRRCDLLARFGGEEFAVLLPSIRPHEALDAAERLRQAVQATRFALGGQLLSVTISIGVADVGSYPEPTLLLGAADSALYAAKKAGRNRVCAAWVEYAA